VKSLTPLLYPQFLILVPKTFTIIFHVSVYNISKKMSENTYILHRWRIRCLDILRCQMIIDLNPPSIIQHKEVSSVLSILSDYETLHTTQTLSCPFSLITFPLKSVHLEYYLTLRHSATRGADKSLARPERKQATATDVFAFHISYS